MTDHFARSGAPASSTEAERVAELHKLCREDYESAAPRRGQDHRDNAHLIAPATEAVSD
ncbi:hypothetical protein [Streptomyces sp. NPDC096311]|uniref:hypothetical protein n=1 Tax=Streptomyces sp. NPDC096311 TaxID=3366083 RepID=UPI00381CE4C4